MRRLYNQNTNKIENYRDGQSIQVAPNEYKVISHLTDAQLNGYGFFYLGESVVPTATSLQVVNPTNITIDVNNLAIQNYEIVDRFSEPDKATKEAEYLASLVPRVVTMRQARLALHQSNLLTTIQDAIVNGTDEALKIEWEYATEVNRTWSSLVALTESLGMTSSQLDDLFTLASTL